MDLGLKGRRALVLAATRGLGRGIAEAIADEGANVLMVGRTRAELAHAAEEITARGHGTAQAFAADLADEGFVEQVLEAAETRLGGVDILVTNTGGPPPGPLSETDMEVFRHHFEMMVMRVMGLTLRLLPAMRARRWGRVLTVASSGTIQPIPALGLSNAVRASYVGWCKSLSNEVAADGVTVNLLLPGRIHTSRVDELDAAAAERQGRDIEEVRAASRAQIPAGRYGTVEEFGAVAAFLVSERASYVTGSQVRCDGGAIRCV